MPLQSAILKGNARLEAVAAGAAPSIKQAPPYNDTDAVSAFRRPAALERGLFTVRTFLNQHFIDLQKRLNL